MHGFMGSGKVFQPLIGPLSEFCNPVTVDLPGHGQSGGSEDPGLYRTERQVRDLHSVLERLQLRPLILHGYSMGGRLALQYAVHYTDWIDALILESTNPGLTDNDSRDERQKLDEERARAIQNNFDEFLSGWQRLPLFFETHSPTEHQTIYESVMQNQKPEFLAASLRGFGTGSMPPVHDELKNFKKPVCLLAGEKDQKYTSILQQTQRQLRNSELHIIPGAGHRVHLDRPENFIHQIKSFTKKEIRP